MIPGCTCIRCHLERDLGIRREALRPGWAVRWYDQEWRTERSGVVHSIAGRRHGEHGFPSSYRVKPNDAPGMVWLFDEQCRLDLQISS